MRVGRPVAMCNASKGRLHGASQVLSQGGVTTVASVLPSATMVKIGQDGKWPLTFDCN